MDLLLFFACIKKLFSHKAHKAHKENKVFMFFVSLCLCESQYFFGFG